MKKIFLIMTISILLFGNDADERETWQSAVFLNEVASSVNEQLPMMIDKETRLDVVYGISKNITYKYTLVNINHGAFSSKQLQDALKPSIINFVCTTPKIRMFPEHGVNMNYSYYSKDGKFMGEFTVTPKDCGL